MRLLIEACASNIPANSQLIRERGNELAQTFGKENISASEEWTENFKNKHRLAMSIISGESASFDEGNIEQCLSDLSTLLKDCKLCNIFKWDETALIIFK